MKLIVAVDSNWGIGNRKTGIPWLCKGDLNLFRKSTMNQIIVVGPNTLKTLPYLPNREIFCLFNNNRYSEPSSIGLKNSVRYIDKLEDIKLYTNYVESLQDKNVYIAGGAWLYKKALVEFKDNLLVDEISLSVIEGIHEECDVYFDKSWLNGFSISSETDYTTFKHFILTRTDNTFEWQYLNLMERIINKGTKIASRNSITYRIFGENMHFDLTKSFPVLTTKRMFWKGVVEEFLFFIRGKTDTEPLEQKGIKIWQGNTRRDFLNNLGLHDYAEGVMGPLYPHQWRKYGSEYIIDPLTGKPNDDKMHGQGIDQLQEVINMIITDPYSRRILLTSYNPAQLKQCVLPPCHSLIIQFSVDPEGFLDMIIFNRSQDVFLGVPFNIASSALLLTVVSKICGLIPRHMTMVMGDTHIYADHIEAVREQLKRIPYSGCQLQITQNITTIDEACQLNLDNFVLDGYRSHNTIKAPMVA